MRNITFLFILSYLFTMSRSAKILAVLPVPALSHQMVFRVLTHELARRGHEVTIITALPLYSKNQAPLNYTEISIHEVTDDIIEHLLTEDFQETEDLISQFKSTFNATVYMLDGMLQHKEVRKLFQKKNTYFDLIFLEDCIKSSLIFSYLFKAPVIQISSFGGTFETFEQVGTLTHPFLYPLAIRTRYHNLSALEKVLELFMLYRVYNVYYDSQIKEYKILEKNFGKNIPTIQDLKKNIDMLFLNIHPIWDSNRPVPPNVLYLGGLHQKPQEELPKELKSNLDASENGVIYVSFGTNVKSALLPPHKLQIFIDVFSKLPYDVFWKWNDEKLPKLAKNIKLSNWFPQSDLLRHPKVKLFITQGGLQSTDEAIAGGVPVIGIPIIWDQWFNVEKYVNLEIGAQLDIKYITEPKLKHAIETVIGDERYKKNILKLRSVMRDQVQSPLEKAVWWTEYVIRNRGAGHLRASSANMDWVEYYEVKLIVYILMIIMLSLLILIFMILRTLRCFVNKTKIE